jgi:hypothetical protein
MSEVVLSRDSYPSSALSKKSTLSIFVSSIALLFFTGITIAQSRPPQQILPDASTDEKSKSNDERTNLGPLDEEMRVKQSLKLLEKEYKANIERAKEVASLSADLRDELKAGKPFGRDETKKLERLEKLAKKIRDEAGGSDEESLLTNPPGKLEAALCRLADEAESLYKTIEKTPRRVVSAAVIEEANVILKLARLTRKLFQ